MADIDTGLLSVCLFVRHVLVLCLITNVHNTTPISIARQHT